jgi:hypothetical protein
MKLSILSLFVLLFILASCSKNNAGTPTVPEDKFIKFYSDLLILQSETVPPKPDSLRFKSRIDSLYHAYNLDTASVNSSIRYYNGDISRWKAFYEKVVKRMEVIIQEDTTRRR